MVDASISVDSVFSTFIRAEITDVFAIKLVDLATQLIIIQNNVAPLIYKNVKEDDLNAVLDVSASELIKYDLSGVLAIMIPLQTTFDNISKKIKSIIAYVKFIS